MTESVFVGGTVFFPEAFVGGGIHTLECVLYPAHDGVCTTFAERLALRTLCQALDHCPIELARSSIRLPLISVRYPAFRPCRLEYGAYRAAYALWERFGGIPVDVLPAAVSVR